MTLQRMGKDSFLVKWSGFLGGERAETQRVSKGPMGLAMAGSTLRICWRDVRSTRHGIFGSIATLSRKRCTLGFLHRVARAKCCSSLQVLKLVAIHQRFRLR